MPARRRPRFARLLAAVVVLAFGAACVLVVIAWLDARHPRAVAEVCTATLDGTDWTLTPEQAQNAAVIAGVAERRGLPAHAVTVALATALQESGLRNLDYGDRDSLGLFQQRPSQGWGTAEQVQDPVYAAGVFYDRLVEVPDWQTIDVTKAAQAVQRSAYADAYAAHETGARAFATALTGWSPETLTCTLPRTDGQPPAEDLTARVDRDLGLGTSTAPDGGWLIDASTLAAADQGDRAAWSVGQWAVAVASQVGATSVQVDDRRWVRGEAGWQQAGSTLPTGQVLVTTG